MAIRVNYGDIGAYAELGKQAGLGVAAEARRERGTQQAMNTANQIFAKHRLQMQLSAQREMAQFDAYMEAEAFKRAKAWELEKMELASRQNYNLQLLQNESKQMYNIQKQMNRLREIDQKDRAVEQAIMDGTISPSEASKLKLRYRIGIPLEEQDQFGALVEDVLGEDTADAVSTVPTGDSTNVPKYEWKEPDFSTTTPEIEEAVTALQNMKSRLDPESRSELESILAVGNPQAILEAYHVLMQESKQKEYLDYNAPAETGVLLM